MIYQIKVRTQGKGLLSITEQVESAVATSKVVEGLCTVFIQHTSASLVIQESADPKAKRDLEKWIERLVPERDSLFTHTAEGPDDMPSHVKAALTATSIGIPVVGAALVLGTWQGIYLWEHRSAAHTRTVIISILKG